MSVAARQPLVTGQLTQTHRKAIEELTTAHDVVFAMVYQFVLGSSIPSKWCRIALLRTTKVTAYSGEVEFYLIDLSRRDEMATALDRFNTVLPDDVSLARFSCET